ncbi:ubiquitin carboxyl-terminal hydrolase 47-like [Brachyistius frenatus]|uniref:ubiquitin carboxyl-terminal hydrolase 47-like n=1 Tax=Brachyistius frenatus TaxID=100188 RepID=UPI0037E738BB
MMSSRKRAVEEETAEWKKNRVSPKRKRPHGLMNQGATCYLNSVLQVLFMTPEILDRLDPKSKVTDRELTNLFEKLEEATCGTENITKSLEIENVYQQRDAAECLEMILHQVSPRVSEAFRGKLTYMTKCSKGHIINEETNSFWTLPLPLRDAGDAAYSVERSFKKIFQTKSYSGDNMVYCNECKKKTVATSGCELVDFPHILTLLLKRFDFDYDTMSHVKSNCCVDVPHTLQTKDKKYKLYGMVNHMGGLKGGHYTAYVQSTEDNTWYYCDDTRVQEAEEEELFTGTRTHNSSMAYLLMYRVKASSESLRKKAKDRQDEQTGNRRKGGEKDVLRKNPVFIVFIVLACALIVIIPVVLTSLSKY